MLDKIRKETASLGSKMIFGFLALVFIFWAGGNAASPKNYAAKVNGQVVSLEEFERRFRQSIDARKARDPNAKIDTAQEQYIARTVFDRLVEEELLIQAAHDLGFVVTDREYHEYVLDIPDRNGDPLFKDKDGNPVSDERYREILDNYGLDYKRFEQRVTRDLLRQKMEQFIKNGVKVTDQELWIEYDIRASRVNLEFVRVTPTGLASGLAVDDAEVAAWADDEDNAAAIKARYDEYFNVRYLKPQTATIQRITVLKPVPNTPGGEVDPADQKAAKKRAELALEAAKVDFSAAAKQFAEGSQWEKDGESRMFEERQLESTVAAQVFGMEAGSEAAMIETSRGYVIVKVLERTPESSTPLEEVRMDLAREVYLEQRAEKQLDEFLTTATEKLNEGATLEEVVAGTGLEVRETGKFTRQREPTALGGTAKGFMAAAFSLTPEEPVLLIDGKPPKIREAYILARLKEREDANRNEFDQAKDSLRWQVQMRKENAAYRAWRQNAEDRAEIKPNARELGPFGITAS